MADPSLPRELTVLNGKRYGWVTVGGVNYFVVEKEQSRG